MGDATSFGNGPARADQAGARDWSSMETLARQFEEDLRRGTLDAALLARIGDETPERSHAAFVAAFAHAELGGLFRAWGPALLSSARPGFGADQLVQLADRHRGALQAPLPVDALPALGAILGNSNVLARLLVREPALVAEIAGALPEPMPAGAPAPDWGAIRAFKYRGLLRISARDALGRWFAESPNELSTLADACLCAALECAAIETGTAAPCMLALGKLGGCELNFSSDVDLVFVYDARDDAEDLARNAALAPFVRALKRGLESPAADGFAYRVDLDLRPEGAQGALVNSVNAALTYYESFGADWERQALIRLRIIGGEREAGDAFVRGIGPFVFRRLIDPGVTRGVRAMKLRIEDERLRAGRDLEADLKEGPGGIRDVEFFVQAFQLVFGGRHPELRGGSVLDVLARLVRLGLLPEGPAAELTEAYTWLRRAEHALQIVEERQTQRFPRESLQQLGLARRMGYRDEEGVRARDRLLDDWGSMRSRVRGHFDALLVDEDA